MHLFVPSFNQGWRMWGESKISSFLFLVLIKRMMRQGEFKISSHDPRGGKLSLDLT